MELWDKIVKANKEIDLMKLKGKDYAEVKERVIAYRKVYPNGQIITKDISTENYAKFKAFIYDSDGKLIASGHARELASKPFALENAETSAIGRALGFCGFGISTSIASFEDMQQIDSPSGLFDEEYQRKKELIATFNKLPNSDKADFLNVMKVKDVNDLSVGALENYLKNMVF